jgi:cytoskeletal protein RodZ
MFEEDSNNEQPFKSAGSKSKKRAKKKKIFIIALSVFLVLGCISYALANRYLIEHVQISNVKAYESIMASESAASALSVSDTNTVTSASVDIVVPAAYSSDASSTSDDESSDSSSGKDDTAASTTTVTPTASSARIISYLLLQTGAARDTVRALR